jgi:hypothetical protein
VSFAFSNGCPDQTVGATKRGVVALGVVVLFSILVIWGAAYHEPWADEAQAWLIARDNSWLEMVWTYLRYEGSSGLWHSILYIPAHLGLPYEASIATVAAASAILGVVLFQRYSPLPLLVSALIPFTFFILYQYAVVARSYCLLLPLLALSAVFLRTWRTQPVRLAVALVLLAHVSVHGALLSLAFMAQIAADMFVDRKQWRSWPIGIGIAAVAIYALNGILLILLVWGPPDLTFASAALERLEANQPVVDPSLAPDAPLALAEKIQLRLFAGLLYAASSLGGSAAPLPLIVVAFGCAVVTIVWMARRGVVFGLVAAILLSVLAGARHFDLWHGGALFLAWMFGLWIAWDRLDSTGWKRQRTIALLASAIVSLHVVLGLATLRQDIAGTYSGARDAAAYLKKRVAPGQTVWAYDYATVGVGPYFDRPIFGNYALMPEGKAFFLWSTRNANLHLPLRTVQQKQMLCDGKPDFVFTVRETRYPKRSNFLIFRQCGYEIEREFPGTMFFEGDHYNETVYILMHRKAGS